MVTPRPRHIDRCALVDLASSGLTLVELFAAIALALVLSGIALPVLRSQIEATRLERAERDVVAIAEALQRFRATNGVWPCRDASGNDSSLALLFSGPTLPTSNPWSASTTWWALAASGADVLDNHLVRNAPRGNQAAAYPTNLNRAWCGSYAAALPLDPWGRPYVVLVAAGHTTPTSSTPVHLLVLSAGLDGQIATTIQSAQAAPTVSAVDPTDIGLVLWRRS